MNFTPTDWDRESEVLLDARAATSRFHSTDDQHTILDEAEDREQDSGYALVRIIAIQSQDDQARRMARAALEHFRAAEEWEAEKDESHGAGVVQVGRAESHLTVALSIAEHHLTPNKIRGGYAQ